MTPERRPVGAADQPDPILGFVDDVADYMAQRGLPRMAGRLFAWLLVAEPPEQTAAELSRSLPASPGSISTMTRLLISLNLVQRVRRPGERADRFRIPDEAFDRLMASQLEAVQVARRLFDRGLAALAGHPPAGQQRVREMRDMWAFWEQELPAIRERWQQTRKESQGT